MSLALDMRGCPNRCRHCYLGHPPNGHLTGDDLRWAAAQFRAARRPDSGLPYVRALTVSSWMREPDYDDDYRGLYALEAELSDGPPQRFELLSIWRLARDPDYAAWAREIGTRACQVSFFGVGAAQDWGYGRPGADDDCLRATEALLAAGIRPRWQLFLTRRLLPDLEALLRLAEDLRLAERCAALGGPFELFMHLPGPDGAAAAIEDQRPTAAEVAGLPGELLAASRRHLGRERLWATEGELWHEIVAAPPRYPHTYTPPEPLCFYVLANWDVYTNVGTLEPGWRLGNLRREPAAALLARYEAGDLPGLRAIYGLSAMSLAWRYGDPDGQRLYSSADDLLALYLARYLHDTAPTAGAGPA